MTYRWEVEVRRWNTYGDKIAHRYRASILADTKAELFDKMRAAFNATYDDFHKFWSHDLYIESMSEEPPTPAPDAEVAGA